MRRRGVAREAPRQLYVAGAARQVGGVLLAREVELGAQLRAHEGGEHGEAVLVALPRAHDELVAVEVDVLDAQAAGFEEA